MLNIFFHLNQWYKKLLHSNPDLEPRKESLQFVGKKSLEYKFWMGRELIEYRCCSIIEGLIKETKGLRKVYPDTN